MYKCPIFKIKGIFEATTLKTMPKLTQFPCNNLKMRQTNLKIIKLVEFQGTI